MEKEDKHSTAKTSIEEKKTHRFTSIGQIVRLAKIVRQASSNSSILSSLHSVFSLHAIISFFLFPIYSFSFRANTFSRPKWMFKTNFSTEAERIKKTLSCTRHTSIVKHMDWFYSKFSFAT